MCVDEAVKNGSANGNGAGGALRVQLVDSWHKQWATVLGDMDRLGKRGALMLDSDGWLSSRQCVLVAFDRDNVAVHLVFRIEPMIAQHLDEATAKRYVEARLDDVGVRPGFGERQVRDLLVEAAKRYATSLRCQRLVGFDRV
jgi:hypothetical protein